MKFRSFSRFFRNMWSKGSKRRLPRKRREPRPTIELLEERSTPATLPPVLVSEPTTLDAFDPFDQVPNNSGGNNPQVAINPTNPLKLIEVHTTQSQLRGNYSNDGGHTWFALNFPSNFFSTANGIIRTGAIIDPLASTPPTQTAPAVTVPYAQISTPSVAIDRAEGVYIVAVQHDAANTSGAVMMYKFDFSGATPVMVDLDPTPDPFYDFNTHTEKVLYRWVNRNPAFNPIVAIDNNQAAFTDPDTGEVFTDGLAGLVNDPFNGTSAPTPKVVYVAWNTDFDRTTGSNLPVTSRVMVAASDDGGLNFTAHQAASSSNRFAAAPQIVFTQGSPDRNVPGGELVMVWNGSAGLTGNAAPMNQIHIDSSNPTGGTVTFASNASPIVITSNSHGLNTGDTVSISGVLGNTAANGTFTITRIDANNFSLNGSTGNGFYLGGGTWSNPNRKAADAYVFHGDATTLGGRNISDGITPPAGGGGDIPGVTFDFTDVNIADPNFTLKDFDVSLTMTHPNLDEVRIDLITPTGFLLNLVRNRVDNQGQTQGPQNNPNGITGANLGMVQGFFEAETVFNDQAPISIQDANATAANYVGHFRSELGSLLAFQRQFDPVLFNPAISPAPLTVADLNGTWALRIVDQRNSGNNPGPTQFLRRWSVNFTDKIATEGTFGAGAGTFGTETVVPQVQVFRFGTNPPPANTLLTGSPGNTYPTALAAAGTPGVGPGIVAAVDNTLGSFSPFQGRIYIAYTGRGFSSSGNPDGTPTPNPTDTDVYLIYSDDNGQTWSSFNFFYFEDIQSGPLEGRVNDDFLGDGFEGTRAQFMPSLAVDPTTGTLVVTYKDARWDPSNQRVIQSIAASIDGGATFSKSTFLNAPKTAIDTATGEDVVLEPIPGNPGSAGAFGWGDRQGLAVYGGSVYSVFASNPNANQAGIHTATASVPAGPRIIGGDMGPVSQDFVANENTYNTTVTVNGTRQLDAIFVQFDRPIDPASFDAGKITLIYRDTATPASSPGQDISNQVLGVDAIDTSNSLAPLDQGTPPTLNISDALVRETNSGTTTVTLNVVMSIPQPAPVTVQYTTRAGSGAAAATGGAAAGAGIDYINATGQVTIPTGQTSTTIQIPIVGDVSPEGNEFFFVDLLNPQFPATLVNAKGTATVIIVDDDNAPSITIGDAVVKEGDSGQVTMTFNLFLSAASSNTVTVQYTTADNTALAAGLDYVAVTTPQTVTFTPGQTTQQITIQVNGDQVAPAEGNETFFINLFNSVAATIARDRATGTIVDDDYLGVSIGDVTVQEDAGTATLTLYLNAATTVPVTVNYTTRDGNVGPNPALNGAVNGAGNDYTTTTNTATIAAGSLTTTIVVPILNDTTFEPNAVDNEKFFVDLSGPVNASILRSVATVTIIDDDLLPAVTVGDVAIREGENGSQNIDFTVFLSHSYSQDITFDVATAVAGVGAGFATTADFASVVSTATVLQGTTSRTFTLANVVTGDVIREGNEIFNVNLSNPRVGVTPLAVSMVKGNAVVTIVDNDLVVTIDNPHVREGSAGTTGPFNLATFSIYLSSPSDVPVVVQVATGGGNATPDPTAPLDTGDYLAGTATITFQPGEVVRTIGIPIFGDTDASGTEPNNETFNLNITSITKGGIALPGPLPSGTATIVDDDATGNVQVTIGNASVFEGPGPTVPAGATVPITFTIFLNAAAAQAETVTVTLSSLTAALGVDFTPPAGATNPFVVNIPQGAFTQSFTALVNQDLVTEGNETFRAAITGTSAGLAVLPGGGLSSGLIVNDDDNGLFIGSPYVLEGAVGTTTLNYPVILSNPSFSAPNTPQAVDLTVETQDGTATTASNDYESIVSGLAGSAVTIAAGVTSTTIPVTVNGDGRVEGNETVLLGTTSIRPGFYSTTNIPTTGPFTGQDPGSGVIVDDDVLNLTVGDIAILDPGPGNMVTATITVYLNGIAGQNVSFDFSTIDGVGPNAARAGIDYVATNGTRTIAAGSLTQTFTVNILGDGIAAGNKVFNILLSGVVGAGVRHGLPGDPGVVTIMDSSLTPALTVSDGIRVEGNAGATQMTFQVISSFPVTNAINFQATTADGLAVAPGDYTALSGAGFTLPANAIGGTNTQTTFTVDIAGDALQEGNETFTVTLSNPTLGAPTNAFNTGIAPLLARATGTGHIVDDDNAPALTLGDVVVREADSGLVNVTVNVLLSNVSGQDITFQYTTADGTATVANNDYVAVTTPQTVTILAGQLTGQFTVQVRGDAFKESNENFLVNIFNARGATIAKDQGTVTIVDDDSRFGATQFLVRLIPQSRTGTYSYFVDSEVRDRIRVVDPTGSNRPTLIPRDIPLGQETYLPAANQQSLTIPAANTAIAPSLTTSNVVVSGIPNGDFLRDVTVTLNLSQPQTDQVRVELVAPRGTRIASAQPFRENQPAPNPPSLATTATLLNNLVDNQTDYIVGDNIRLQGTTATNTPINVLVPVGPTTTVGDLINAINTNFPGSTASIVAGQLIVQATSNAPGFLSLTISDNAGNSGATAWSRYPIDFAVLLSAFEPNPFFLPFGTVLTGGGFVNTIFDDQAEVDISEAAGTALPPFTGRFRPDSASLFIANAPGGFPFTNPNPISMFEALSRNVGNLNGNWGLRVVSFDVDSTGLLSNWALKMQTGTLPVTPNHAEVQSVTVASTDEVQLITTQPVPGGTFTLTFGGDTTFNLPAFATAGQVQFALNILPSIGGVGGFVQVFQGFNFNEYFILFGGTLSGTNVAQITGTGAGMPNPVGTTLQNGGSGSFTLTFNGQTTGLLAGNSTAAQVEAALNALTSIAPGGSVTVNKIVNAVLSRVTFEVTFAGNLAGINVPQMTATGATVSTLVSGGTSPGNYVDTNMSGNRTGLTAERTREPLDGFAAPNPTSGTPFKLPYTVESLPIIIPGPHPSELVFSSGSPTSSLNLAIPDAVRVGGVTTPGVLTPDPEIRIAGIPDGRAITKMKVRVGIDHVRIGDIKLTLIAPDGTRILLKDGDTFPLPGAHFDGGIFDDDALVAIDDPNDPNLFALAAPYHGSFKPAQPLEALYGKAINGTWKLHVEDLGDTDVFGNKATGVLRYWSLIPELGEVLNATTDGTDIFFDRDIKTETFQTDNILRFLGPVGSLFDGKNIVPEVQTVNVTGGSGTFTLTFDNVSTAPLAFNATAAQVEAALNGLSTIGGVSGAVSVTKSGTVYTITFVGGMLGYDQTLLQVSGTAAASVTQVSNGAGGDLNPLRFHIVPLLEATVGGSKTLVESPGAPLAKAFRVKFLEPKNTTQTVTVNATAGTFTLTFMNQTTGPLNFNATASQVQGALNGLTSISGAGGSVVVTQIGSVYTITFQAGLSNTFVQQLTATGSGMPNPVVTVTKQLFVGGTYTMMFGPDKQGNYIEAANGDKLDVNMNAGLDLLRGGSAGTSLRTTFSSGTLQAGNIGSGTQSFVINVTDDFLIEDLNLQLNIVHPDVRDLQARLVAPGGQQIQLFQNEAQTALPPRANFFNTIFDDTAVTPIQLGSPPFSFGPFKPRTPFSVLNDTTTAGNWTLIITNNGGLAGTLTNWSLDFLKSLVPVQASSGALPDNNIASGSQSAPVATNFQINVTDDFTIRDLDLQLDIEFGQFSQGKSANLLAELRSPGANPVTIRLFDFGTGSTSAQTQGFFNTIFDDSATVPIQQGTPPFNVGPFNPRQPLNQLVDSSSAGTWTLTILNRGTDQAHLKSWSLLFKRAPASSGLGEGIADQFSTSFRIFTTDPTKAASSKVWTAVGPASENHQGNSSRIGGITVDPSDPTGNTVYVAGASGGLWKTSNFLTTDPRGPTYIPLLDLAPTFGLNIGSVAVFGRNNDPNQSIIFVATGEGDTLGAVESFGIGFLRSRDGGRTWEVLDSSNNADPTTGQILPINSFQRDHLFSQPQNRASAFKIIVDPNPLPNGDVVVYAALSSITGTAGNVGGIWRSVDTGKTWVRIEDGQATDVVLSPEFNGVQVLYGAFRGEGVFITTSPRSGIGMTQLTGGQGVPIRRDADFFPPPEIPVAAPTDTPNGGKGRIVLATPALTGQPAQDLIYQGWLYAAVATSTGGFDGLYLTKDFGLNWTKVRMPVRLVTQNNVVFQTDPTNDENFGANVGDLSIVPPPFVTQGNYDIALTIDPNNPNVVYLGGSIIAVRVDTSLIDDPWKLVGFEHHNNDGGLVETQTAGAVTVKQNPNRATSYGLVDPFTFDFRDPLPNRYLNVLRDPDYLFLAPSTFLTTGITNFNNTGTNVRWQYFDSFSGGVDYHEMLTIKDPITGASRLIVGNDQGVFTVVDRGDGTTISNVGAVQLPTGARNGNLQLLQMYYGAVQPSTLAADLAGSLFYGMAQDNGYPVSTPDAIRTGNLNWNGGQGDGGGIATDQTGSGTSYGYRWPCCVNPVVPPFGNDPILTATDFFLVKNPGGDGYISNNSGQISRTTGLVQQGDNPGASPSVGQWPGLGTVNFAVNPVDRNGLVISSAEGRIFRTTNLGQNWFEIGAPAQLGGTAATRSNAQALALAFGAPNPNSAILNDYIVVGTEAGRVFFTLNGGGPGQWIERSTGLDGSSIQAISTNPQRGSHEVYAVTFGGVYWIADITNPGLQWQLINGAGPGGLFNQKRDIFNDPSLADGNLVPHNLQIPLQFLTSLAVDWRFAIPDDLNNPSGPRHPVLYVGGAGGVYRSIDKGLNWTFYPNVADQGAPQEGGYLPNAWVTDLDLALGNINPSTGKPNEANGMNLLMASTYGRGAFAIRLDNSQFAQWATDPVSGPRVTNFQPEVTGGNVTGVLLQFSSPVDPSSFTLADLKDIQYLRFTDGSNNVTNIVPPNGNRTGVDLIQLNSTLWKIAFSTPITVSGDFDIAVGPNLSDSGGNAMNQNGPGPDGVLGTGDDNFVNGEDPGDVFVGSFFFQVGGNGAPAITPNNAVVTFPGISEDPNPLTNLGVDVQSWFNSSVSGFVTDPNDPGAPRGIAVTLADNSNGQWQYSVDGGNTWNNFGSVSDGAARLLRAITTNRIRFVPNADFFGNATFEFRAWDRTTGTDGGAGDTTINGGTSAFSSNKAIATINVSAVNDPPTFTVGANVQVLEDAPPVSLSNWATNVSGGPNEGQTVTFQVVSNDNSGLFASGPSLVVTGSTATLNFTLAQHAFGVANISIQAVDSNVPAATSAPQSFTITVDPVNDAPSFTGPTPVPPDVIHTVRRSFSQTTQQTIAGFLTNVSPGAPNESAQTLTFNIVSNSNPGLFTVGPAFTRQVGNPSLADLTFTPNGTQGQAAITINVTDSGNTQNGGQNTSTDYTFIIDIGNQPPTITAIANVTTNPSQQTGLINFTVSDIETPAGNLTVSATSSNNAVVANNPASFTFGFQAGGGPGDRTLRVTPTSTPGQSTITVTVSDGTNTAQTQFIIFVNASPTLNAIADTVRTPSPAVKSIGFTASDPDSGPNPLSGNASVITTAKLARDLDNTLQLSMHPQGYFTNFRNAQEKYIFSNAESAWYFIRPDSTNPTQAAEFRKFNMAFQQTNPMNPSQHQLIARLDRAFYDNPALLHDAPVPPAEPVVTANFTGNPINNVDLNVPTSFIGTLNVTISVTDGIGVATRSFLLFIQASTPNFSPIGNASIPHDGVARNYAFTVTDPENDPLTASATIVSTAKRARDLDVAKGFVPNSGGFFTNFRNANEKYIFSSVESAWYFLVPDGRTPGGAELRKFNQAFNQNPMTPSQHQLIARLDVAYYNDPLLLIDAPVPTIPEPVTSPTFSGSPPNNMNLAVPASFSGSLEVVISATDGGSSASQSFVLYVQNQAPVFGGPLPNSNVARGAASTTVNFTVTDPEADAITPSAVLTSTNKRARDLDQALNFTSDGNDRLNTGASGLKWIFSQTHQQWYFIMPDSRNPAASELRRFGPALPTAAITPANSPLVARLDINHYNDTSLLHNAPAPPAEPVFGAINFTGNPPTSMTINNIPANFSGTVEVVVRMTDSAGAVGAQSFILNIINPNPPTIAFISNVTVAHSAGVVNRSFVANDADGDTTTQLQPLVVTTQRLAYNLDQQLALFQNGGSYYTNFRGAGEKYIRSATESVYYVLMPDANDSAAAELRRWNQVSLASSPIVARFGVAFLNDPTLLHNAFITDGGVQQPPPVDPSFPAANLSGSHPNFTLSQGFPTSFTGDLQVTARVTDGASIGSQMFLVHVVNSAPTLTISPAGDANGNYTMAQGTSLQLDLLGNDPDNDTLSFTVSTSTLASLAYQLDQQFDFIFRTDYFQNAHGQNEKWIWSNAQQAWWSIRPDGRLTKFGGQGNTFGGETYQLDPSFWQDPSLLWNAQPPNSTNSSVGTTVQPLSASSARLTLTPHPSFTGSFTVTVDMTDGIVTVRRTFRVIVQ